MWQLVVILSSVFSGLVSVLNKTVVSKVNPIKYAFYFNMIIALFYLVFSPYFVLPKNELAWLILFIGGILWSLFGIFALVVYNFLDVSLIAPLSNLTPSLVLLIGVLFFNETLAFNKMLGLTLMLAGAFLITFKKKKSYEINSKGILIMSLLIIIGSVVSFVDKISINLFNIYTYAFGIYLLPSFFISLLMRTRNIKFGLSKDDFKIIFIVCLMGFFAYVLTLYAYTITEVSNVSILSKVSIVVSLIGGFVFHKEKGVLRKSFATGLIILGALAISS